MPTWPIPGRRPMSTRLRREAWAQWLRSLTEEASIALEVLQVGDPLKPGPILDAWLRLSWWWREDMPTPDDLIRLGRGDVPEHSPPGWSKWWIFDGTPPWISRRGSSTSTEARKRQRRNAALGLHPFGMERWPGPARCRDCRHCVGGHPDRARWAVSVCSRDSEAGELPRHRRSAYAPGLGEWPACEKFEDISSIRLVTSNQGEEHATENRTERVDVS